MSLDVLSAGAAQGAVTAIAQRDKVQLEGAFGAVGAMKQKLLEGVPCDLIVLTRALIDELWSAGHVGPGVDIGRVATAIAVREGDPVPDVSDAEALRAALLHAEAIYIPDPHKATAGIHFAGMLDRLGIREATARALKAFPNGATAMREMAATRGGRPIGCTQATEILNTPGTRLVAPLPPGFGLETVYAAAICTRSRNPEDARRFLERLAGDSSVELRRRAGFEL